MKTFAFLDHKIISQVNQLNFRNFGLQTDQIGFWAIVVLKKRGSFFFTPAQGEKFLQGPAHSYSTHQVVLLRASSAGSAPLLESSLNFAFFYHEQKNSAKKTLGFVINLKYKNLWHGINPKYKILLHGINLKYRQTKLSKNWL